MALTDAQRDILERMTTGALLSVTYLAVSVSGKPINRTDYVMFRKRQFIEPVRDVPGVTEYAITPLGKAALNGK